MHHIFVSYSRREKEWVASLVAVLRRAGLPVWIDTADIRISAPWFEEVTDAITEADLFLICDSEHWRVSVPCNTEAERASAAQKPILRVPVGSDIDDAARSISGELRDIPIATRLRTELATLARDWERAGRPRSALVSRRQVRRLRRAERTAIANPVERTFLRSSVARARRRTFIGGIIAVTVLGSALAALVIYGVEKRIDQTNNEQATIYARNQSLRAGQANDPIVALATAAELGGNESFTNADYISDAFSQPEPDDAFKVPPAARRFAERVITTRVTVVARDGHAWSRAATARSVRIATSVAARPQAVQAGTPSGLTVRLGGALGAVEVRRNGVLLRRIYLARRPAAAVISPDGRLLAVAQGNAVDLVDIALGQTRTVLRGGATTIRDVAWSADGNQVWALGPGIVMMWDVRQGVLVDEPTQHFEGLLPASGTGDVWVAAQNGRLREISIVNGRVRRSVRVHDTITSAAGSADGTVAAISGIHGLWIVRLSGPSVGSMEKVTLPNCALGRAAFENSASFRLPCLGGPVLTISTVTGHVTGKVSVSPSGAFAVKFLPRSGVLLVSDEFATLYTVDRQQHVRMLFEALCGGSIGRIAVAPDDSAIIPVGAGTGVAGCSSRLELTGGNEASASSWHADSVVDNVSSAVAQSAAISRGGKVFAYGYDDGTVVLHPMLNITPTRTVTSVVGAIRDMLVTSDDQLIVATDSGVVQRIGLCETCLSNRALAVVARNVVNRELAIGVAKRARSNP